MAADWLSTLGPHMQPAVFGAASGFVTGLLLRRLVQSLLVTVGFALAVGVFIASTTNWLEGMNLAAAGRQVLAYAKAHQAPVVATVRRLATSQLGGLGGFAVGLAGGIVFTRRRRPVAPKQS